jgi:hypothetical protein
MSKLTHLLRSWAYSESYRMKFTMLAGMVYLGEFATSWSALTNVPSPGGGVKHATVGHLSRRAPSLDGSVMLFFSEKLQLNLPAPR